MFDERQQKRMERLTKVVAMMNTRARVMTHWYNPAVISSVSVDSLPRAVCNMVILRAPLIYLISS